MADQQRTRLSELYRYIGDEGMSELPSLRQSASRWSNLLRIHPELQSLSFANETDFARYVSSHPQSGLSPSDFTTYEKYLRYSSYFPDGRDSEELQHDLQVEQKNDEASFEQSKHDNHGMATGHGFDFFADLLTPKSLEKDRAFRRILKQAIKDHNRLNPNTPFIEKMIVKVGKDKIFNPNLPPQLLEQSKAIYGQAHGGKQLKEYESLSRSRIYKTMSNDPVIQKMERQIKNESDTRIAQLEKQAGKAVSDTERTRIEQNIRNKHTAQFVKDYPEKSKQYSRVDATIKYHNNARQSVQKNLAKIEKQRVKEIKKIYRNISDDPTIQRLTSRVENQTALEVGRRRAEIAEKAKTTYAYSAPRVDENAIRTQLQTQEFDRWVRENPKKAARYADKDQAIRNAYERYLQQEEQRKQQEQNQIQIRKLKDPSNDTKLKAIKDRYPNRTTDPIQQKAYEKEMERFVEENERSSRRKYKKDKDVIQARERLNQRSKEAHRYGKPNRLQKLKNVTRRLSPSPKTNPLRKLFSIGRFKNIGRNSFKSLASASRLAGREAVQSASAGIPKALSALNRGFSLPKSPLGVGINPLGGGAFPIAPIGGVGILGTWWFWVIVAVILLLLIILGVDFTGEENNGEVSVSITKIGPTAVPNPSEQTPTELTYTLNVSYTGNPTQINVVDELPDEVEIVEGSISNNGTYNPDNHTVTWNININNPETSTGSTSGEGCYKVSDPPGSDWEKVNSRDEIFLEKVKEVEQTLGICVPVNLVKALVYLESGGEDLPPNGAGNSGGYRGVMQVDPESWCDHTKYNVDTIDGNVGCGIEHLAHTYDACGTWEGAVNAYYAGGCSPTGAADDPAEGGSGKTDNEYTQEIINRWKEIDDL